MFQTGLFSLNPKSLSFIPSSADDFDSEISLRLSNWISTFGLFATIAE